MQTSSIDIIKSNPGIWVLIMRGVVFIEVESNGTIHQLKPDTFERDGVLREDRWNMPVVFTACGPLARPEISKDDK